ncbi:chaperone NapD [Xanthomonas sp. XNM01]|jgi:nitrate reductase NapD|uniref:chaperone NapD n=1 Tax=Xanthomonas sp. XNM01 TaxID=2769289 RepID=UPI00178761C0|nr:chaperone NapD [Xanthomonas sp. XNM01]MBD9367157.1 chaperone NapD [Xanthomonas sp. XNM01]
MKRHDVHIASFVVQHRAEALDTLLAAIAASDDLELAGSEGFRSIVLCESGDQYALMDRVESLRALPGVLGVNLVYHHAEPREALDAPLASPSVPGAAS